MAIIKAVSSKSRRMYSIKLMIKHVTEEENTISKICESFNCRSDDIYQDMKDTKKIWGKTEGRQYYHFIQSWSPEESLSINTAFEIGTQLAYHIWGDQYEFLIASHETEKGIHNHIIVNSVSWETGRKFNNTRDVLRNLKSTSDALCLSNGLSVIKRKNKQLEE